MRRGATVLASGALAALLSGSAAAQAAKTTRVYAIAANYSDTHAFKQGPQALRRILRKVGDFHAEGSDGAHTFVGEVHPGTLELPQARPAGRCRQPDRAGLSAMLRDGGIDLGGFDALVLVVPPSAQGCPGGVRTTFEHHGADGTVRRMPLAIAWSLTERYIAHEILHTYGLGHANRLACRKAALAPDCKVREYGNTWDLMGHDGSAFQMVCAPLRAHLGWTTPVVHAAGRARYTIGAATRPGGLPTAVEVRLPPAKSADIEVRQPLSLWIEYRAPFGADARMDRPRTRNFAAGAMVNLTGSWQGRAGDRVRAVSCPQTRPCLLDMNPQTSGFDDAGLAVGQTWTEPFSGAQIGVEASTATTLTVSVLVP